MQRWTGLTHTWSGAQANMQVCAFMLVGLAQLSISEIRSFNTLTTDFGKAVLRELEEEVFLSVDHREQTEQQLHEFEGLLQTTFKALPKNGRGALEDPYARYALHRLFLQRYGWQVKGLEMTSGAWYAGTGVGIMGDRLPPKIRELFEKRLGSQGLLLDELALLAVTLNAMFRHDVYDRLSIVYAALDRNRTDILSVHQATQIGHAYMSALVLGNKVEELHAHDVLVSDSALRGLEGYRHTERFLSKIMVQVAGANPRSFDWELMMLWLLAFGQQLGRHEAKECRLLKTHLIQLEAGKGTGRVRLADFHKASDQFQENLSDLRSMYAVDETDPDDLKVIIPNYVQGATNCINPAGHYSICCFDECEALMDQIEAHFEAPAASPGAIFSFVASLSTDSQPSTGTLAPELLEVLKLLAMDQGGMVPLHSKHFARWMHQVYPRECSYPQHAKSDRFDHSLRQFVEEVKAEHVAKTSTSMMQEQLVDEQSQSISISYKMLITCGVMGVVGAALSTLFRKTSKRDRGKSKSL